MARCTCCVVRPGGRTAVAGSAAGGFSWLSVLMRRARNKAIGRGGRDVACMAVATRTRCWHDPLSATFTERGYHKNAGVNVKAAKQVTGQ